MNLVKKLRLSLTMLAAAFCVQAATETVNGIDWEYEIRNEGAVVLSARYNGRELPWVQGWGGILQVPQKLGGVSAVEIGDYFMPGGHDSTLTKVVLPDTIVRIGESAFEGNNALAEINFPDGLKVLSYKSFEECGLVDITIPNGVREIPENCFRQCFALKKVYFSEGVCNVGMSAFEECSNLREVYFPSTIERISIPFVDCDNLKIVSFASGSRFVSENNVIRTKNWDEIVCVWGASSRAWNSFKIPETVRKIGDAAFIGCEKLRAIHIPSSVEEIGINPFICCYSIESITLDSANKWYKIENDLLLTKDGKKLIATAGSYKTKRRDIVVPEGVEEVGCLSLTSDMVDIRNVWMPASLKKIHDALEWGGNGGKSGEYGAMENVVFMTQDRFEVEEGACLFCDCDIDNVWFAGPVPENFDSKDWWECGNVRKIHYTPEYKNEWEAALQRIGYGRRGEVNVLEEFPTPRVNESEGILVVSSDASVYDGYLSEGNKIVGRIQAKVAKPKKGSAKVTVSIEVLGLKKVTVKGEMDVATGILTGLTKDGKTLSLKFNMNDVSGNFDGFDVAGYRDLFSSKDKVEKAEAENALAPWIGALNMKCGNGVLSVTVAKKGKVTIKGTYNGEKVSAKAQALIGEDMICIPVVYSKKSVNLAFTVWLPIDGGNAEVVGLDGAVIGKAGTLKSNAKFRIDGDICADISSAIDEIDGHKLLPDGENVAVSGKKWVVADGAKAAKVAYKKGDGLSITEGKKGAGIANASGLKLTYKSKDGSFSGSFTVYALENNKLKKHKATVSGVLINGVGYGTATIKKLGSWGILIE